VRVDDFGLVEELKGAEEICDFELQLGIHTLFCEPGP